MHRLSEEKFSCFEAFQGTWIGGSFDWFLSVSSMPIAVSLSIRSWYVNTTKWKEWWYLLSLREVNSIHVYLHCWLEELFFPLLKWFVILWPLLFEAFYAHKFSPTAVWVGKFIELLSKRYTPFFSTVCLCIISCFSIFCVFFILFSKCSGRVAYFRALFVLPIIPSTSIVIPCHFLLSECFVNGQWVNKQRKEGCSSWLACQQNLLQTWLNAVIIHKN